MSPQGSALAKDTLPERVLEAARRCLVRYGVSKTGIADIASEAGVSRQSIYTHFGDRSNLISQALEGAGEEFADRVATYLTGRRGSALDLVIDAVLFTVREMPQDPLLRAIGSLERDPERDALVLDFGRAIAREFSLRALGP